MWYFFSSTSFFFFFLWFRMVNARGSVMLARRRRIYFVEKWARGKNSGECDVRTSAFIASTKRVDVCLAGYKGSPIFLPVFLAMKILSLLFSFFFHSLFLTFFVCRNEFHVIERVGVINARRLSQLFAMCIPWDRYESTANAAFAVFVNTRFYFGHWFLLKIIADFGSWIL